MGFASLNILKPEDSVFWYMCGDTVVSPGSASAAAFLSHSCYQQLILAGDFFQEEKPNPACVFSFQILTEAAGVPLIFISLPLAEASGCLNKSF